MTAANIFVSQLYHVAVEKGINGSELLAASDIDIETIDAPQVRVDTQKLAKLVQAIWDALDDESMGLSRYPIPRGAFFTMGKLAIHEPNLGRALTAALRFYAIATKAFTMSLEVEGDLATLRFDFSSPERDRHHLLSDINLMAWHRFSSWIISENIILNEIYFQYPTPTQVSEYTYLFPGQHRFNSTFQGFSFHKKFLEYPIKQSFGALKAFVRRCPFELFRQPKTDFSVSSELQKILTDQLQAGFPVIDEVANTLHLTKRTLMRKLKSEGTSYQKIKDLVRRDRAINLLTEYNIPLGAIAEEIGFSDPAVFARAFKTWTGVSPREYRLDAAKSRDSDQG